MLTIRALLKVCVALAVGEETGAMDALLMDIAAMYERETAHAIKGLSSAIEPVLLLLIGGLVLVLALWLFIEKTRYGLIIRAGSRDPEIVRVLGIDVSRVWLLVFGIGTAIAGLSGVLAAPTRARRPAPCCAVWAWASGCNTAPRCSRAGSSSAWRWRGLLWCAPSSCWPTNPPAAWTTPPARPSWT